MQQPPVNGVSLSFDSFRLIRTIKIRLTLTNITISDLLLTYLLRVTYHWLQSMIDCVIARYLDAAVFFTHGKVQSAEGKRHYRKLHQSLHQFFPLVHEYRHTRPWYTGSDRVGVNYTVQWCYVRGIVATELDMGPFCYIQSHPIHNLTDPVQSDPAYHDVCPYSDPRPIQPIEPPTAKTISLVYRNMFSILNWYIAVSDVNNNCSNKSSSQLVMQHLTSMEVWKSGHTDSLTKLWLWG